jgi:ribosome-associated translation inhibitor RaiA
VNIPDFDFESYSKVPDPGDVLRTEALNRLLELAEGHDDIIGASVSVEELSGQTTPHQYEVRVVAFVRPDNITAVEKADTARGALKGALSAVERQVRESREKLRETWKRP